MKKVKLGLDIVKTFLLFAGFCVVTISCLPINSIRNMPQDMAIIRSAKWVDLEQLPVVKPPIVSAQEAISFTTNIESVRSSLENVALRANFVTWNVTSQLKTKDDSSWWEVKIKSTEMLPSFTCLISFTHEGELTSSELAENYCEYNK